jgi:Transmembrane amino acid transporter protein
VLPAVTLICIIGILSGYGFSLIGRVCAYTGGKSYPDAWSKSIGDQTSWIPAVSATFKTIGAVLAYSMILADTGLALAETAGFVTTRTKALLGITGLILLPLCWLKDLASLGPFSLIGSLGMVYTTVAMAIRYFSKSYAIPSGEFKVAQALSPSFGNQGATSVFSPSSFILICMLSTAYMAHFK